ncbi:hypothetical protein P3T76_007242 [Phytophthora citrophthora]|uniref:Serine protease family S33 n=1 Tax=Phytophthora citrophthora TaxID=4793 RepID=A0AAD9LMG3_9STRA|nr:hypothetical protein P3T76_007242 [Phytophthora citrophthora]
MDHRGTGQSAHLACSGSSTPPYVEPTNVPMCAQELHEKYGDLSAFSTMSAATDLLTFISDYGNDFSTIIYGVEYGTIWVERAMHLDPAEVTGYVLDGVSTTSGARLDLFANVSIDTALGEVGDAFIAMCAEDCACGSHFKKRSLKATIQHLFTAFDKDPNSKCASFFNTTQTEQNEDPSSFALRTVLGLLLSDSSLRTLIPPVVYRLARCSSNDIEVLNNLVEKMSGSVDPSDSASLVSFLLDNLIIFSEMWESPTPPTSVLKTRFEEATMSTGSAYVQTERYCAYTKEKSATCGKLKLGGYKGYGIVYERDEYWNKAATIPGQASVLILSSKLNPLAPHKDAEALLKAMVGDNKELVAFEYTAGSNLMDSSTQELCGMSVLVSYVQNEGKLEKLEKSCVAAEVKTAFYWTPPLSQQYVLLSTSDAYDGEYDKSLSEFRPMT